MASTLTEIASKLASQLPPQTIAHSQTMEKKQRLDIFDRKTVIEPQFIKNDNNMVLLNVPIGKPNRKKKHENDPSFVPQPAYKGETCFYYALKLNAMMQPNYLQDQNSVERKIASEYRKERTLISCTAWVLEALIKSFEPLENKNKVILKLRNALASSLPERFSQTSELQRLIKGYQFREPLTDFISKFQENSETDVYQFLKDSEYKEKISAAFTFLRRTSDLDPMELITRCKTEHTETLKAAGCILHTSNLDDYETFTLYEKLVNLEATANYQLCKIYKTASLDWNPVCNNIDDLLNLLQKHAKPLLVMGYFGVAHYSQPPKVVGSMKHYQIKGFTKNTRIDVNLDGETSPVGHMINVIGVEKNPAKTDCAGWVYYTDPVDGCDSTKGAQRIIYKMSYEQFCNALQNTTLLPVKKTWQTGNLKYLQMVS